MSFGLDFLWAVTATVSDFFFFFFYVNQHSKFQQPCLDKLQLVLSEKLQFQ